MRRASACFPQAACFGLRLAVCPCKLNDIVVAHKHTPLSQSPLCWFALSLSLNRVILFAQRPYASACLITHNGTSNSNRRLFLKFKNLLYVNLDQVSHLMCGLLGPKIVLHRSFVWLTRILIITTIMTISIKDMKIIILKAKNNKTRTKTSKTTGLARANSCLERSVNK